MNRRDADEHERHVPSRADREQRGRVLQRQTLIRSARERNASALHVQRDEAVDLDRRGPVL